MNDGNLREIKAIEVIDMYRKGIKFIFTAVCMAMLLTACTPKTEDVSTPAVINEYFVQGNQEILYGAAFSFYDVEQLEKGTVSFHFIKNIDNGQLFELFIDCGEEFSDFVSEHRDRFHLGYFYVTEDKIVRIQGIGVDDISKNTIDSKGTIVCQSEPMPDVLGEDEKGWHESIDIEGNITSYVSYNNAVETGFHEYFIWEKGKGLVKYASGFGAWRDGIQLWLENGVAF